MTMPFLCFEASANVTADDYTPEVTARVARISFLRGDVQIRRPDNQDWERATQNLPLVEGDEIATSKNGRIEIQFDRDTYLRLAENSYLKILNLKDEGIALSLPQGTLSVRLLNFDKDRGYFEIDAPQTTIAVQKEGMYRVDAGDDFSHEVRVSAMEKGEARVYSQNSAVTLRDGRTARVFIRGNYAGESDMVDASLYADEFETWSLDRDAIIAKRLRDSHYDKYYDRDIYGAEDLSEHGEWIYTRKYGYVWRPFSNTVSRYADWSPYRYGHWRWIPPYGWTWVNDEPWGWATYHHGRWVYDDGYWLWTPYGYHRPRRSWWRPALVVIIPWGRNICWYPLPYDYRYYNYNSYHSTRIVRNNTTIINNNTTVVVNPTPAPTPSAVQNPTRDERLANVLTPPLQRVPLKGVVAVEASEFGRNRGGFRTPQAETAREILTKTPDDIKTPKILPTLRDLNGNVSEEIVVRTPKAVRIDAKVKTGATERVGDISTDREIRQRQVFGNRSPIQPTENTEVRTNPEGRTEPRKTGAVTRSVIQPEEQNVETRQPTRRTFPENNFPNRSTGKEPENRSNDGGEVTPPARPQREKQREEAPPVYSPPPARSRERREDSPPSRPPTKREEPRNDPPPKREEPRQQPVPKRETPPQKSEPKEEPKSPPATIVERKTKGRDN
ncbi:MAG TPA: DUF6600 domain-containing protein [Pyrinomonadaceae bacterium]|nr:DUF6600 domain-containing protein [Pyrinomonadaceae bacterium]